MKPYTIIWKWFTTFSWDLIDFDGIRNYIHRFWSAQADMGTADPAELDTSEVWLQAGDKMLIDTEWSYGNAKSHMEIMIFEHQI